MGKILTVNTDPYKLWGDDWKPEHDYSKDYLTFEALEDGTFAVNWTMEFLTDASDDLMKHISYSVDNGETWTTQEINDDEGLYVEGIKAGQTVLWKGDGLTANSGNDEPITFNFLTGGDNAKFNVYGNIMSLIYGDDFEGKEFDDNFDDTMGWLFENSYVVSAKNLILPDNVFTYCYQEMFKNCTELTEAPKLSATTLANGCYVSMFYGCTSLTEAPELPATVLAQSCYSHMFKGCTSLNYVKMMATNISASNCLGNWLSDAASTGTLVINSNYNGYRLDLNVPYSWTILNEDGTQHIFPRDYREEYFTIESVSEQAEIFFTVPDELVSDELVEEVSYKINDGEWVSCNEIQNGSSIYLDLEQGDVVQFKGIAERYAGELTNNDPQSDSPEEFYSNIYIDGGEVKVYGNILSLFYGDEFQDYYSDNYPDDFACAGLFKDNDAVEKIDCSNLILSPHTTNGCYFNMFANCECVIIPPALPATTLSKWCYEGMFSGCTSLTLATALPATRLAKRCYRNMFNSCTSLTTAPELPATIGADECYMSMFYGCSNLNYIKAMFDPNYNTSYWVENVAANGTFIKNGAASWSTGRSGIPEGWTVEIATS